MIHSLLARSRCCLTPGIRRWLFDRATGSPNTDTGGTPCTPTQRVLDALPALFMLSWFVRLSVACIERMHKYHRDISSRSMTFDTFAARSVVGRVQRHFASCAAEAKARTCAPAPTRLSYRTDLPNLKRAVSPFEVFRNEYQIEAKDRGRAVDLFSEAGRREVKLAWEQLSLEDVCACEEVSEYTKDLSRRKRCRDRGQAEKPALPATMPAAQQAQPLTLDRSMQIVPSTQAAAADSVLCCPADVIETLVAPMAASQQTLAQTKGIHHSMLEAYYAGHGVFAEQGARSKGKSEAAWRQRCSGVGAPTGFPEIVVYPTCCGASCLRKASAMLLGLRSELRATLANIVSRHSPTKKPKGIAAVDCILKLQGEKVGHSDGPLLVVRASEAVARSGRKPATQAYFSLVSNVPGCPVGATLSLVPQRFVVPTPGSQASRAPLIQATTGKSKP